MAQPGRLRRPGRGLKIERIKPAANPLISGQCVFRRPEPALAHSLNANILRKWVIDAESALPPKPKAAPPAQEMPLPVPTFVPLALPAATIERDIRVELQRGGTTVTLVWPANAARECAAWLSDWLR